jgi:hypothetical protein
MGRADVEIPAGAAGGKAGRKMDIDGKDIRFRPIRFRLNFLRKGWIKKP